MIDAIITQHTHSLDSVISNLQHGAPGLEEIQRLSYELSKVARAVTSKRGRNGDGDGGTEFHDYSADPKVDQEHTVYTSKTNRRRADSIPDLIVAIDNTAEDLGLDISKQDRAYDSVSDDPQEQTYINTVCPPTPPSDPATPASESHPMLLETGSYFPPAERRLDPSREPVTLAPLLKPDPTAFDLPNSIGALRVLTPVSKHHSALATPLSGDTAQKDVSPAWANIVSEPNLPTSHDKPAVLNRSTTPNTQHTYTSVVQNTPAPSVVYPPSSPTGFSTPRTASAISFYTSLQSPDSSSRQTSPGPSVPSKRFFPRRLSPTRSSSSFASVDHTTASATLEPPPKAEGHLGSLATPPASRLIRNGGNK